MNIKKGFTLIELPVVRKRAFTLIELLVVIAIIGILATLVMVNYSGAQAKTRDAKRITDLSSISSAIVMFHDDLHPAIDNGSFVAGSYVKRNPCNAYYNDGNNRCPNLTGIDLGTGNGACVVGISGFKDHLLNQLCLTELINFGYMTSLPHDPSTTEQDISSNDVSCDGPSYNKNRCYAYLDQWATTSYSGASLFTRLERYSGTTGMTGTFRITGTGGAVCDSSNSDWYCIHVPQ